MGKSVSGVYPGFLHWVAGHVKVGIGCGRYAKFKGLHIRNAGLLLHWESKISGLVEVILSDDSGARMCSHFPDWAAACNRSKTRFTDYPAGRLHISVPCGKVEYV